MELPFASVIVLILAFYLLSAENLSIPKCEASNCEDAYAECFNFTSTVCCVCPPGFNGGGWEKCIHRRSADRFIRLKGMISIKHPDDNYEHSFPISHETITIRGPPLGQTAIYDVPSMGVVHNTLRLLTPLLHYINSLTSFPTENSRIYNIFSLTGGFSNLVRLRFNVSYQGLGNLLVDIQIQRSISDSDYYEGNMNVEVRIEESFKVPKEIYVEKQFGSRVIHYSKIARGVLRFRRQRLKLTTITQQTPKVLRVGIIGTGYVSVDEAACLLQNGSLLEEDKDAFSVRLDPKGYCNTACPHSSTFCTIYCLDYPVLESQQALYTEAEGIRKPRIVDTEADEEKYGSGIS
ncbi:hypothetical protein ECG_02577 [Echinococcus granulosus]|uniref:Egf domain protein n=1 Tax=Echinococcus granulosus TaxID=6210 RepID=A0A068WP62_ECHGR|nr:hypothetical protein ECG_02577 [Echinococcus granulosus]CDS21576.1 egf domain protein [Echinococcus granulosus]